MKSNVFLLLFVVALFGLVIWSVVLLGGYGLILSASIGAGLLSGSTEPDPEPEPRTPRRVEASKLNRERVEGFNQ